MNEPKASRYHRLQRRTAGTAIVLCAGLLTALMTTGASVRLAQAAGGSVAVYVLTLVLAIEIAAIPFTWYRTAVLDRQYGLAPSHGFALGDSVKGVALSALLAVAAAELVYAAMRAWPTWWWLAAAAGGGGLLAVLTSAAPILLPLFHRSRPLHRDALHQRLLALSRRAGVEVLAVHEWGVDEPPRRATAALVGVGTTRRILLSGAMLSDYTDDEIEVVLAHEIGHHVHGDILKGLGAEFLVLAGGCFAAALALGAAWRPIGLAAPSDVAGLPIVLLAAGGVRLLAAPLLNALSRHSERRADMFALEMVSRPDAFIGAVRRMGAQNLAEERPTRAARWLFHTHPTVDERIAAARMSLRT